MAGEDSHYIARLHDYACAAAPCANRDIEASHPRTGGAAFGGKRLGGKPGKGQRSEDRAAYPLCRRHHGQAQRYEFSRGFFAGWSMQEFRAWEAEQGALHYARYLDEIEQVLLGSAPDPVVKSVLRRQGFDPKDFAARWCLAHGLGEQMALDLGRDLKRELKEGGVSL